MKRAVRPGARAATRVRGSGRAARFQCVRSGAAAARRLKRTSSAHVRAKMLFIHICALSVFVLGIVAMVMDRDARIRTEFARRVSDATTRASARLRRAARRTDGKFRSPRTTTIRREAVARLLAAATAFVDAELKREAEERYRYHLL
jgi:hypothetical protein